MNLEGASERSNRRDREDATERREELRTGAGRSAAQPRAPIGALRIFCGRARGDEPRARAATMRSLGRRKRRDRSRSRGRTQARAQIDEWGVSSKPRRLRKRTQPGLLGVADYRRFAGGRK